MKLRAVAKAVRILRDRGLWALWTAIKERWNRPSGSPEPEESIIAFEALSASRVKGLMVDVGAHLGGSLAPFVRQGWRVFAIEPDSVNRAALLSAYGQRRNVTIDARAMSDHPKQAVTLFRSDKSAGISGLSAFHPSHQAVEQVEVTTLSQFFGEHDIGAVDFLKIDTEGFDLFVLKGVPWETVAPRLVLCEFEDTKTVPLGYRFHDLARYLLDRGYKIMVSEWYPIVEYGAQHRWRRFAQYPCELQDERGWGNLLAAKDATLFESLFKSCSRLSPGVGIPDPNHQ